MSIDLLTCTLQWSLLAFLLGAALPELFVAPCDIFCLFLLRVPLLRYLILYYYQPASFPRTLFSFPIRRTPVISLKNPFYLFLFSLVY